jgi:hypothetical protein
MATIPIQRFFLIGGSGLLALAARAGTAPAGPTFNKDVAPILYQNCTICHRPGEVAPFPLLTYQDAARRARLIAAVTRSRYMPPWKAEPGHGAFQDERRLTAGQIAIIGDWAGHGAPEGDPADRPKPPVFASGWLAGQPDFTVTTPQKFRLPAGGRDQFQCFVIPLPFTEDRYARTVEFHPGNPKIVHHALFFLDTSGTARELDAATPEPGYNCFGGPGFLPAGGLGGWAPGATPQPLPPGVAQTIKKGSDLVVQIHYHPSGKPEEDQSSLGITFTDPPAKGLAGMILGTRRIDIPAGEAHYTIRQSLIVPMDVELIGITPHAHLLCREMKADARLPDGTITPLIWIKDWDFNWQGQYRYASPVKLPKATRIEMEYTYDNSEGNPRNPNHPPKRVTFGEQTTDEMALLFLQATLPSPAQVPVFRVAMLFSRIEQFLREGGDALGVGPKQGGMLRQLIDAFDRNHDGTLDPDERQAMLEFLRRRGGQ